LCIVLYGKPIAQLWSIACHMESYKVTCHVTDKPPSLNPLQPDRPILNLPTSEAEISPL